jgi:hypothetical protein
MTAQPNSGASDDAEHAGDEAHHVERIVRHLDEWVDIGARHQACGARPHLLDAALQERGEDLRAIERGSRLGRELDLGDAKRSTHPVTLASSRRLRSG